MAIHVAIEGYDSLEQIGVGGMAAVYKARKISIDKTVAIKVLFPYLATDASFTDRFQREAKAAASIQHDNVVNVLDFGESEGSFYIVMEYYDGRTLEDLMKGRSGIPFDIAVQVLLEVAHGLQAAHALDTVHRDIKPANIIYTNQGGIKIADFGLAKKSDSVTMITQMGKVIGTPAYMSPEQAAGRAVGPPSDIFSLGVVAYELLTRRKPFEGKTYSEVLEKIQTLEPPALGKANPLIPPEFERIVGRMLSKDDRGRHADATALIAELEDAMEKVKIPRDRSRLASYIRDPDAYDAKVNEKLITQCLSRGAFYMQKGEGHLDDAALEFRRILFVDPGNSRARKNLERIENKRESVQRTVTMDAVRTGVGHAVPAQASSRAAARARRRREWFYAAALVVALAAGGYHWLAQRRGDVTSASRHGPPAEAGLLAAGDPGTVASAPVPVDTLTPRRTAADEGPDAAAKKTIEAPKPAGDELIARADPKPAPAKASDPGAGGAETPAWTEPKPAPPPAREPVRPADGSLSVYFLGGVGEIKVNGKPFPLQPPFEAVPMRPGTYRIACRMTGDETPKEVLVTIVSNRETVIEYEVGAEPVASNP